VCLIEGQAVPASESCIRRQPAKQTGVSMLAVPADIRGDARGRQPECTGWYDPELRGQGVLAR